MKRKRFYEKHWSICLVIVITTVLGISAFLYHSLNDNCNYDGTSWEEQKTWCEETGGTLGFWGNECIIPVCHREDSYSEYIEGIGWKNLTLKVSE